MSGRKNRKNKSGKTGGPRGGKRNDASLVGASDPRKLKPLPRNILLLDLVVLSICQILLSTGTITDEIATGVTFIAFIGILVALYIQFLDKSDASKTLKSPKNH